MKRNDREHIIAPEHTVRADAYPLHEFSSVGSRVRRKDGYEKASGCATYTSDVQLPGMLHARIFTSPYPNAKIKTMNSRKAERLPGVRAILRYDDPGLPPKADLSGHFGQAGQPHEAVLNRCGYWQGMPKGVAVAADTEDIAGEALNLVEIEWEIRPFNLDPEKALEPGAPLTNPELQPEGNFVLPFMHEKKVTHGDIEKGFREADQVITFRMRRDQDTWIGPERPCGIFRWNGEYPEVWLKHQRPHLAKRQLADFFRIGVSQITVRCLYQGASFGGWSQMALNMQPNIVAGILAKRTGRPVRWQFSTAYCQIAADELGFRYGDVQYRPFDETGFTPMTPDSSTNLAINGWAVRNAARQLKRKILEVATTPRITEPPEMGYLPPFEGNRPEDLDIKDSMIYVKNDPAKRLSMAELVRPAFFMGKMDIGSTEPLFAYGWQNQQGAYDIKGPPGPRPVFVRQAHFVEVEVDPETGGIGVTRVANANDVGRAINPDAVEGQQYGGSVMGVSRVRTEEVVYCPATGVVLNGNLIDYKINTMLDCGLLTPALSRRQWATAPTARWALARMWQASSPLPFMRPRTMR